MLIYADPIDKRKSIDSSSILVELEMYLSLRVDSLFVSSNRNRDKIKILCGERTGFIIWHKRLEKQLFRWPKVDETLNLLGKKLSWLLDGINFLIINHTNLSILTRLAEPLMANYAP